MKSILHALTVLATVLSPVAAAESAYTGPKEKRPAAARGPAGAVGRTRRLQISGIYPHLTAFNKPDPKSRQRRGGGAECGIGAVVPWAGKLWMITYSPHCPQGSSDKLYAISADLTVEIRPESVGGTPAGRMIHRESKQLFIGPYAIDAKGKVRVIPPSRMPGRHTGIARHLTDPANKVYYFDMEGAIHEVDVNTLAVKKLFAKPVAGWHGKGAYTGQGRYIIANNGELGGTTYKNVLAGGPPKNREEMGALAEWDGKQWRIVERKQFCDVTGPGGIHGSPDDKSPVWSIGWDRRSVILKLLSGGKWYTFRMPKGTHTYDHRGGFYTEWPRIREIMPGKLMMDMHGMFWDFPKGFDLGRTGGIRPMSTHLRYIPDFCHWNGRVVLATDETAMVGGNKMAGQSQSNLWFGTLEDLHDFGPRSAWGGPWVGDAVKASERSTPFLVNGFARRCLHLSTAAGRPDLSATRCTGRFAISEMPAALAGLPRVTMDRGDYHKPAPGYSFTVNKDVLVYLAVDDRGSPKPGDGWQKTAMKMKWVSFTDTIYQKEFKKGRVDIPGNDTAHKTDAYGVPHTCFIKDPAGKDDGIKITALPEGKGARVARPRPLARVTSAEVTFGIEVDVKGDGTWTKHKSITVAPGGYRYYIFPSDFEGNWVRFTVDKDCTATAFFHLSGPGRDAKAGRKLFAGLADVTDGAGVAAGLIRPGGHNRNLQYLAMTAKRDAGIRETYYEVDAALALTKPEESRADEVRKVAAITKEFEVDEASVIMTHRGRRYRLPKGHSRYDKAFATGWPRGTRECESERYLVNIHGTFYEKPREAGLPRIKPVATHGKQIMDFCTWRGLLVISGMRTSAARDGHVFRVADGAGLWFGGIDDVWKLGKPVGRGGPWCKTPVEADTPSDAYLMTNYDKKTVELSHDGDGDVTFTIEVNFDHRGWHRYTALDVPRGKKITHEFPDGFGAHWVRVRADKACKATAQFLYE